MRVRAAILAAGEASRLGTPKALARIGSESFLERLVRVFRDGGVDDVIAVVGGTHTDVSRAEAARLGIAACLNEDPADGPISSIRAALEAGRDGSELEAWLFHPVDIPGVEPPDVAALVETFKVELDCQAVQPEFDGRRAHPVLVRGGQAKALLAAPNLREFLRGLSDGERSIVPSSNAWLRFDIDTPEDLAQLHDHFGSSAL